MTDADKKLYDKAVEALDQMGAGLPSEIEKYVPAWIDGYKEGLKAKINATTISVCPIKDEWRYMKDVNSYDDLPQETVGKIFIWKVKTRDFNGLRSGSWEDLWFDMNDAMVFCYKEIEPPKEEE